MRSLILFSLVLCHLAVFVYCQQLACTNSQKKLLGMKTLSAADKQKILHFHNAYRNHVASGKQKNQPPAENMLELAWDDSAEIQAFNWAGKCNFEHNSPKDANNNPMGQNLALKMYSLGQDVNTAFSEWMGGMIKSWYDEVAEYKFGDPFSLATGHYTQMVWANTAKVGCGFSYYRDGMWYVGYLACNYSPAGNYVNQKPYRSGKANCKKYSLERSSRYPFLCRAN